MRIYTAFPIRQTDIFRMLAQRGVPSNMIPALLSDEELRAKPIPGSKYDIGGSFRTKVVLFTSISVHLAAGGRVGDRPITGAKALAELNRQGWERKDLRNPTHVQKMLWLAALLEVAKEKTPNGYDMSATVRLDGSYDPLAAGAPLLTTGSRYPDSYRMFHALTGGMYRPERWAEKALNR